MSGILSSWMRIAIDTNMLIAALTKPGGASAGIVGKWAEGELEVVASEATIREAELVLGGGWLARMTSREDVEGVLRRLRAQSVLVNPSPIDDLATKDAGDLRLVEAAVSGGANYLVTTDRELLSHRGHRDVEFVTPAEFLRILASQS